MHEDSFYGVQARFLIAVDCTILGFIDNEIKLLTFRRKIEPKKGGLSLLGGFMNENENIDHSLSGITIDISISLHLLHINIVKPCQSLQHPTRRLIDIFIFIHKTSQ